MKLDLLYVWREGIEYIIKYEYVYIYYIIQVNTVLDELYRTQWSKAVINIRHYSYSIWCI